MSFLSLNMFSVLIPQSILRSWKKAGLKQKTDRLGIFSSYFSYSFQDTIKTIFYLSYRETLSVSFEVSSGGFHEKEKGLSLRGYVGMVEFWDAADALHQTITVNLGSCCFSHFFSGLYVRIVQPASFDSSEDRVADHLPKVGLNEGCWVVDDIVEKAVVPHMSNAAVITSFT